MKRAENFAMASPNNIERLFPCTPEPVDRKIAIEASRLRESKPLHDCETGSVDDREILIAERHPNRPGTFQVCRGNQFHVDAATPNAVPKLLGNLTAVPAIEQQPRFDKNVVGCNVFGHGSQDGLGAFIIAVS